MHIPSSAYMTNLQIISKTTAEFSLLFLLCIPTEVNGPAEVQVSAEFELKRTDA